MAADPEDRDDKLYELLNVPRTATNLDIERAFEESIKDKSRLYAHHILTSPKNKRIYDKFGLKGLRNMNKMAKKEIDCIDVLINNLSPGVRDKDLFSREKEKEDMMSILEKVVYDKESMSVVIYGEPGGGKSSFVETCISELKENEEDPTIVNTYLIIHLNGLWCKDLKLSIGEIYRQLNLPECEDDFNNFDDRLDFMLTFLRTELEKLGKSVIFVLDNIDFFTNHKGQMLLYNLLDISQSKVPIGFIGITNRLDFLELLEKRVKSRFSHRQINLKSYSLEEYLNFSKDLLGIEAHVIWNKKIWDLFKDSRLNEILSRLYEYDKSLSNLTNFLYCVLLTSKNGNIELKQFEDEFEKYLKNSKISQALDLSIRELLVLIGIHKQVQNTSMAFQPNQIWGIISASNVALRMGIDMKAFMNAFENLEMKEMVFPATDKTNSSNKSEVYYKTELDYHEFKEIFKLYPNIPTDLQGFL